MKKFLLLALAAVSLAIVSCSDDDGPPDAPDTINLAKHWFVRVQGPMGTSAYSLFSTRTTIITEVVDTLGNQRQRISADTITLDDHNLLTPSVRAHVKINTGTRTFGEGMYRNWNAADSVILKEGRIFRLGGRSKSGSSVDSIYLKYAFKSAPGTEYVLTGHERTGLLQDEY